MKYKLKVSHNCGVSYLVEQESDNLEELKKEGRKLDEQTLRWAIDNEKGEQVEVCAIHKGIVSTMEKVVKKENRTDPELQKTFDTWDKGEYTYDGAMEDLIKLEPLSGEKLGDIMKDCTICPVGNGTCFSFMTITVYGFHPDKVGKHTELMICALGIEGDGEKCPLNK